MLLCKSHVVVIHVDAVELNIYEYEGNLVL